MPKSPKETKADMSVSKANQGLRRSQQSIQEGLRENAAKKTKKRQHKRRKKR